MAISRVPAGATFAEEFSRPSWVIDSLVERITGESISAVLAQGIDPPQ
jgi:hypothetical protein